jgi:type I restriction enzyme S subunit
MGRNQSVGVAAYVGSDTEFVLGQDTVLIQPSAALNNKYAFYAMQSAFVQRQIFKLSGGSTFSRINLAEIRKLKIPVTEQSLQKKIAQTLSTWDKAIDTVERLIENSKTQKKALMQKLLLGSERLPGYDDEWNVRHLEDIAIIAVSPVDKKSSPGENTVRLCNYTDVYYNEHISDDMNFMVATASDNEIERFSLRQGDVVITKDSETPDDIAIPAYVEEEPNGVVCGYHLAIIRPDPDLADGQFLTYLFSLPHTRYYFFTLANGATRFGLTTESIRRASFSTPGIDEQKAIAKIIRTADTELSNLRKQRDALREEKKALMQQLLTGKRRVLPSKEA